MEQTTQKQWEIPFVREPEKKVTEVSARKVNCRPDPLCLIFHPTLYFNNHL